VVILWTLAIELEHKKYINFGGVPRKKQSLWGKKKVTMG
jgi:hypothetical protein